MAIDLLVFSSGYCPPCRAMEAAGVYDEVRNAGFNIDKVDTQSNPALANQFGISAIPTLIIRKNGMPVGRMVGARDAATLIAELRRFEE